MIIWMLYSALLAAVVAAAARAAEWLARLAGARVRWIWAGALALTVFLSGAALVRNGLADAVAAALPTIDLTAAAHVKRDPWWLAAVGERIDDLRRLIDAPLRNVVATTRRAVPPAVNVTIGALAAAISIGLVGLLVGVGRKFRRARREWPLSTIQGVDVRVAPCIGPVVLGFVRPEIVVPRWLLTRHADEQRLVVTHEAEHVRALDPLLLGLGWVAVVAAPWSPAMWYMLSRLRLAVELDCDARVLRRGATPRSYGSLLIDVAQHASALRLSALALADDSSHLHQRILAMRRSVPRFARLRAGLAAAFALGGVLVACESTLPTRAELAQLDAAAATRAAHEPAKASETRKTSPPALIFIDGVRATESQMRSLNRAQIESVEVLKGAAAAKAYGDVAAVNGVVTIKTKRGGDAK